MDFAEKEISRLRLQLSELQSPHRLLRQAARLKMHPPTPDQFIVREPIGGASAQ